MDSNKQLNDGTLHNATLFLAWKVAAMGLQNLTHGLRHSVRLQHRLN